METVREPARVIEAAAVSEAAIVRDKDDSLDAVPTRVRVMDEVEDAVAETNDELDTDEDEASEAVAAELLDG